MSHLFELKDVSVKTISFDRSLEDEVHLTVKFDHRPDAHYDRHLKKDLIVSDFYIAQYICKNLSKIRKLNRNDFVDHISQFLDERFGLS